jgi:hypothetical protein
MNDLDNKKKPKHMNRRILFFFMIALIWQTGFSQLSNTLYHMPVLPQSGYMNPAVIPEYSFYFGLPALGGLNTNFSSNFISYNDVIFKHPTYDSLILFLHPDADVNDFIGKLKERNRISPELSINILMFGFKAGKSFFSFQVAERSSLRTSLPRDIIELGLLGNEEFVGRTTDFSKFGIDFSHFREYSLGFSTKINELIQVGVRGKMLFGKGNIQLANHEMSIYTDPDTYEMLLRAKLELNISAPTDVQLYSARKFELSKDTIGYDSPDWLPYFFSSKNMGFAFDAGVIVKPISNLTLSASLVDLGFINWQRDVKNISVDGEFEFNGFDFNPFFEYGNEDDPFELLKDSLDKVFERTETQNDYRTGLGTKLYVGANYQLTKAINIGFLSRSEFYRKKLMQSVSLSANFQVGSGLSTILSYSIQNNTYDNIGLGLGFREGPFLWYLVSDNLTGFFLPHKAQTANFLFGLNFVFGYDNVVKKEQSKPFF